MAKEVTYVIVREHIGGTLRQGEDFLELLPFEFANKSDAYIECINQRNRLIEEATEEYKKLAQTSESKDQWECLAWLQWGPDGDVEMFRTCLYGYRDYDK